MYLDHFNLDRHPFKSKPDPEFLYLSKTHAPVKSYLDFSVWNKDGLVVVTGRIGSGKTTLVKHLLTRLEENILAVNIHQTQLNEKEFLQSLLFKLGVNAFNHNKAELLALLNTVFSDQHAQGRRIFLVVDEAQHLSPEVLEEIRFLTGIEIDGEEVFNCIFVGHAELMDTINAPGMEQLAQRVRLRIHIPELSEEETQNYIYHRLAVAGHRKPSSVFPASTISLIYEYTEGIPRRINILCDAAMISAYAEDAKVIANEIIRGAVEELQWNLPNEIDQEIFSSNLRPISSDNCAELIIRHKGRLIKKVLLDKECMTLGRSFNNNIVLRHELISRHHAQISVSESNCTIEDLGSKNGTFVKDKKTKTCVLRDGDAVKIGPYELLYVLGSSHPVFEETIQGERI